MTDLMSPPIDLLPNVDTTAPGLNLDELPVEETENSDKPLLLWIKKGVFSLSKGVKKRYLKLFAENPDLPEEEAKSVKLNLISISKKIIASPFCNAVISHDATTLAYVKQVAIPPYYRKGLYLIPLSEAFAIQKWLVEREQQRILLVKAIEDNYDEIIKSMVPILGPLFSYSDYPDIKKVLERYVFVYKFFNFDAPLSLKTVSLNLYQQEKQRSDAYWTNLRGEIKKALLLSYDALVSHMITEMSPNEPGTSKRFSKKAIKEMENFISTFTAKNNVTDYAELADLVEQSRAILAGMDVSVLKKDTSLKEVIVEKFKNIQSSLDTMVEEVGGRSYSFLEDDETEEIKTESTQVSMSDIVINDDEVFAEEYTSVDTSVND